MLLDCRSGVGSACDMRENVEGLEKIGLHKTQNDKTTNVCRLVGEITFFLCWMGRAKRPIVCTSEDVLRIALGDCLQDTLRVKATASLDVVVGLLLHESYGKKLH